MRRRGAVLRTAEELRKLSYGDVIRRYYPDGDVGETWVVDGKDDDVYLVSAGAVGQEWSLSSDELIRYYDGLAEFTVLWVEPNA